MKKELRKNSMWKWAYFGGLIFFIFVWSFVSCSPVHREEQSLGESSKELIFLLGERRQSEEGSHWESVAEEKQGIFEWEGVRIREEERKREKARVDGGRGRDEEICEESTEERRGEGREMGAAEFYEEEQVVESPFYSSWIGEPCRKDSDCPYSGGYCLKEKEGYKKGHCTKKCTRICPDKLGKPITFCIENAFSQGYCVRQCEKIACRAGYICQLRARFHEPSKVKKVCVPAPQGSAQGKKRILYIGDSQSSGSKFAFYIVNFLRNPRSICPSAKSGKNEVHSYAKVSSAARHWGDKSGVSKNWLCRASKIYVNGTAATNTTGAKICQGILSKQKSIFQKLIERHQPDTFLVQLGSNSIGLSESFVKSKVKNLLEQMPPSSLCYWVAPTYGSAKYLAKKRAIERWLKEVLQNYRRIHCHLITSIDEMSRQTTCHPFNTPDGLHLTYCSSLLWGKFIAKKICAIGGL